MTPERWRPITELFHLARERHAGVRPAFLDEACADDLDLRREVERLLAADHDAGRFDEARGHRFQRNRDGARNVADSETVIASNVHDRHSASRCEFPELVDRNSERRIGLLFLGLRFGARCVRWDRLRWFQRQEPLDVALARRERVLQSDNVEPGCASFPAYL